MMQTQEVSTDPGVEPSARAANTARAARTIAVVSQKGGVGKTTVSLNLAVSLAQHHGKTLLVDIDPQGGVGLSLAKPDTHWAGLVEALVADDGREPVLVETHEPRLSLLVRGRLNPVDVPRYERLIGEPGRLADLLKRACMRFDYVIIDTPAGVGMATVAALEAAQFVLPLYQANPLAARSIAQMLEVIEHVKQGHPELQMLGLLPTMVAMASAPSQAAVVELWTQFEGVLETSIPQLEAFQVASEAGLPLAYMERPHAVEARRFDRLADELVALMREEADDLEKEQGDARRTLV